MVKGGRKRRVREDDGETHLACCSPAGVTESCAACRRLPRSARGGSRSGGAQRASTTGRRCRSRPAWVHWTSARARKRGGERETERTSSMLLPRTRSVSRLPSGEKPRWSSRSTRSRLHSHVLRPPSYTPLTRSVCSSTNVSPLPLPLSSRSSSGGSSSWLRIWKRASNRSRRRRVAWRGTLVDGAGLTFTLTGVYERSGGRVASCGAKSADRGQLTRGGTRAREGAHKVIERNVVVRYGAG